MAYAFSFALPAPIDSPALVRGIYASVHINAPGFTQEVHRTTLMCQTERFADSRPAEDGVTDADRLSFVVDVELLLYSHLLAEPLRGRVLPCLFSGLQLASPGTRDAVLNDINTWRAWWTGYVATSQSTAAAATLAPVSDLAVAEVCIGIHAYTPVETLEANDPSELGGEGDTYDDDEDDVDIEVPKFDMRALGPDARRIDEYETQLAEVCVPLWLLLELAHLHDSTQQKTRPVSLPILGNNSRAWSFLRDASDARLAISCASRVDRVPAPFVSHAQWPAQAAAIRTYIKETLIPAAAQWRQAIGTNLNRAYTSCFARGIKDMSVYRKRDGLRRFWSEMRQLFAGKRKIPPYKPQLYGFHAMRIELYSKPEFVSPALALAPVRWVRSVHGTSGDDTSNEGLMTATRESIPVPVWYYALSRRPALTSPDTAIWRAHVSFFLYAFKNTLTFYGMDGALTGAQNLRNRLMVLWKKKAYLLTEDDRCDLVASNDIIAQFLSSFGWMGKYHSDMGAKQINSDESRAASSSSSSSTASFTTGSVEVSVLGTESCDFTRLAGTSCSDDCEGSESCVRDGYVLCVKLFTTRDVRETIARILSNGSAGADSATEDYAALLSCMMTYTHAHYDYYGVSGETAGSFTGIPQAVPSTPYAGDDAGGIERMRTGFSALGYASEQDAESPAGFHQYAILMPVALQYQMTQRSLDPSVHGGIGYDVELGEASSYRRIIEDYAAKRASVCDDKSPRRMTERRMPQNAVGDAFVPPAILLEGVYPTSTLLIGPSVFAFYNLNKRPYPTDATRLTRFQRNVIAADISASISTLRGRTPLKQEAAAHRPRMLLHALYKRTPGVLNADMTRLTTFAPTPRFSSGCYRRVCHGINVTMLETLGMDTQINAACAFVTFVNGQTGGFGVPLEDFQLLCLPEGHPDALTYPMHELAHPYCRAPESMYDTADALEKKLRLLDRLPPVNVFGDFQMPVDIPAGALTLMRHSRQDVPADYAAHSISERILKTRVVILENPPVTGDVIERLRTSLTVMTDGADSTASVARTWHANYYPHFTGKLAFVSVIEK